MKIFARIILIVSMFIFVFGSLGNTPKASFVVNSVNDGADANHGNGICATSGGECTLRAALQETKALVGPDTITFNIPGSGSLRTINLTSQLPTIDHVVTLDGSTQSDDARVQINGTNAGYIGLWIAEDGCVIHHLELMNFSIGIWLVNVTGTYIGETTVMNSSLDGININGGSANQIGGNDDIANVISRNARHGIQIANSDNNLIYGNYIGIISNFGNSPNEKNGIFIGDGSQGNIIGGSALGQPNYIVANDEEEIRISGTASGNILKHNYIQIKPDGSQDDSTGIYYGILIDGADQNEIGGSTFGDGNYICSNIKISSEKEDATNFSFGNIIQGNQLGTSADGLSGCLAGSAISIVDSSDNIIGGIGDAGNLIAGYRDNGIILTGELTTNNTIQGNQIGFDSDGQPLGGNVGISIYEANNNLIGGLTLQTGNEIANQSSYGIVLSGEMNLLGEWVTKTENNKIQSNLIHNNGDVGICLNPRVGCPTLNDYYDADLGPNHLINFPVIYLADYDGAFLNLDVVMPGLLNVTLTYSLDYFTSSTCDPSGYGEGETFFRNESVIANVGGGIRFQRSWPAGSDVLGKYLTITATDPDGNTSEFSKCALIKYPNDVFIPLLIK